MDIGILAQYIFNGIMLGMMYALVAIGFSLFFGVLDVIHFSHGDVLMVGAFTGFTTFLAMQAIAVQNSVIQFIVVLGVAVLATAFLGALIGKYLILPLKSAPPLNTLLITLMLGSVLRESIRLFFPDGSNPKPFPSLLSERAFTIGKFILRIDSILMLLAGLLVIVGLETLINNTKIGLAIRAVAQDEETAKIMGINYSRIVLITFVIGSMAAAFAGIMNGIYYSEINFGTGLLLGVIGFSSAVMGGLGNIRGAILGAFLFAALQTIGAVALPFQSAYKDVFAFGVVIMIMTWRPTGLIAEKVSERV